MLLEKRTGQTPKVPKSRLNIDAYLHENLDRPGSFNVSGGYFLDGKPEDFDPTAFGMTPIEAQWLDPQQRRMLEVSYECIESAGIPLEKLAGSNTAVFIGSFTSDYRMFSSSCASGSLLTNNLQNRCRSVTPISATTTPQLESTLVLSATELEMLLILTDQGNVHDMSY
jgi:acyl transferase domain-containing protein